MDSKAIAHKEKLKSKVKKSESCQNVEGAIKELGAHYFKDTSAISGITKWQKLAELVKRHANGVLYKTTETFNLRKYLFIYLLICLFVCLFIYVWHLTVKFLAFVTVKAVKPQLETFIKRSSPCRSKWFPGSSIPSPASNRSCIYTSGKFLHGCRQISCWNVIKGPELILHFQGSFTDF